MSRIATITCPQCQHEQKMFKPDDRSVLSFQCERCHEEIWSQEKECIYCEFGDSQCKAKH